VTMSAMEPVWLVSEGRVLAAAKLATTRSDRRRGLLGATSVDEPLVLVPCSWVHTIGMKVAIDVAHVSADGLVLRVATLKPWRVGAMNRQSRMIVEAAAGSFERWNLRTGSPLEVRYVQS
jgi:uncharacterized membrane protein (UPF0127 family)